MCLCFCMRSQTARNHHRTTVIAIVFTKWCIWQLNSVHFSGNGKRDPLIVYIHCILQTPKKACGCFKIIYMISIQKELPFLTNYDSPFAPFSFSLFFFGFSILPLFVFHSFASSFVFFLFYFSIVRLFDFTTCLLYKYMQNGKNRRAFDKNVSK